MLRKLYLGLAIAMGLAAEANGVFMLVSPINWYFAVPGVTTTGPFNQHFVRDIGLIFLFIGTSYLVGAFRQKYRVLLWSAPALWLCGHALFHYWEVAVGICEPYVLSRDFPAVTLPAIIGLFMTAWSVLDARKSPVQQSIAPPNPSRT